MLELCEWACRVRCDGDAPPRGFDDADDVPPASTLRRSRTAVAPLERLKILMQVQGSEKVYTGVFQVRDGPARVAGVGRIGGTQCHVSRPRVHVCVLGGGVQTTYWYLSSPKKQCMWTSVHVRKHAFVNWRER